MKISIVTICNKSSYGACLQAFSLYNYLLSLNHKVFLQKFKRIEKKHFFLIRIRNFIKNIYFLFYFKSIQKRNNKFDLFINNINFTEEKNLPLYICGSDQIWHPGNLNKYFTLKFTDKNSVKSSYAASMGLSKIEKNNEHIYIDYLKDIKYISVREQQFANEINRITNKKCRIDIDPTFLNNINFWIRQEIEYKIKKPYVLLFFLYYSPEITKLIKTLKKDKNINIYMIDTKVFYSLKYKINGLIDIGPREFLYLIHHAEKVYTSSFHGVAFSIIFEKQFEAFVNPNSPSRINNILHISGIDKMNDYIDYDIVKSNLAPYIESSKNYLKEIISYAENQYKQ